MKKILFLSVFLTIFYFHQVSAQTDAIKKIGWNCYKPAGWTVTPKCGGIVKEGDGGYLPTGETTVPADYTEEQIAEHLFKTIFQEPYLDGHNPYWLKINTLSGSIKAYGICLGPDYHKGAETSGQCYELQSVSTSDQERKKSRHRAYWRYTHATVFGGYGRGDWYYLSLPKLDLGIQVGSNKYLYGAEGLTAVPGGSQTLSAGQEFSLIWWSRSLKPDSSCTASADASVSGWSGTLPQNSSNTDTYKLNGDSLPGSVKFTITCTSEDGSLVSDSVTVFPSQAIDLGVNGQQIASVGNAPIVGGTTSVDQNGVASLTWWTKNVKTTPSPSSCKLSADKAIKRLLADGTKTTWSNGARVEANNSNSSVYQFTPQSNTKFTLSCTGLDNEIVSDNVVAEVTDSQQNVEFGNFKVLAGCTLTKRPKVDLSWDQVADATTYRIYRISGGNPQVIRTQPQISYSDTNVQKDTDYSYYVEAYKGIINSDNLLATSDTVEATTFSCASQPPLEILPPNPPKQLKGESICAERKVTLSWQEPAGGGPFDIYNIYRGDKPEALQNAVNGKNKFATTNKGQETYAYNVSDSERTIPYSYCVTAYNTENGKESSCSNVVIKRTCPFSFIEIIPH